MKSEPHPESPASMLSVEQCDRDFAADIYGRFRYGATIAIQAMIRREIERGQRDDDPVVQAFARHRHHSLSRSAGGEGVPTINAPEWRKAVARLIDPDAWVQRERFLARVSGEGWAVEPALWQERANDVVANSLAKADAILNLLPVSPGVSVAPATDGVPEGVWGAPPKPIRLGKRQRNILETMAEMGGRWDGAANGSWVWESRSETATVMEALEKKSLTRLVRDCIDPCGRKYEITQTGRDYLALAAHGEGEKAL